MNVSAVRTARLCGPALALLLGAGVLTGQIADAEPLPPPTAGVFAAAPAQYQDPFYAPPADFGTTAPGAILRSRPVSLPPYLSLTPDVQAWQLLYRTSDSQGRPMATATLVLRPAGAPARGVISYQIPEDASTANCAPTRYLSTNPAERNDATPAMLAPDLGPINAILAQHLAVSVPDYEGPDSEWGAARQPGYAILDGLRAAEAFSPLGLHGTSTPAALWGYSGGSLASGWAAQLQPKYASELDIRGVALGGFITDPGEAIVRTIGTVFSGVPISVLPGLIRTSPVLVSEFTKHLTPSGKALMQKAGSQCMAENTLAWPFVDLTTHMDMPFRSFMNLPDVRSAFADLKLGDTTPAAPLFVYHSVNDEMVPIAGTDRTVAEYCSRGASVTYVRDQASEHGLLGFTGAPAALNWLTTQLGDHPERPECTTRTVTSALTLPTPALLEPARAVLSQMQNQAGKATPVR